MNLKERIAKFRDSKKFNAKNCLNRQTAIVEAQLNRLIADMKCVINTRVSTSSKWHKVIFDVDPVDRKLYEYAIKYFTDLGFKAYFIKIEQEGDEENLVISWNNNNKTE
jgi:hypothetical protein